jgi:F0F1-type ATP synthase membrane subunit b/b'
MDKLGSDRAMPVKDNEQVKDVKGQLDTYEKYISLKEPRSNRGLERFRSDEEVQREKEEAKAKAEKMVAEAEKKRGAEAKKGGKAAAK